MKVTVDISKPLLKDVKILAKKRKVPIKAIFEKALRLLLSTEKQTHLPFKLKNGSFKGNGVCPGIREGDWQQIQTLIYKN